MKKKCQHFTKMKCNELLELSQKNEELFNEIVCTWKTNPVDFELKQDVKPILSRPYQVLKVHKEMFQKKVEHLVLLEFLERANNSEWGDFSFA